jgi:EmrB/QacA subfamily drug resistance transporter
VNNTASSITAVMPEALRHDDHPWWTLASVTAGVFMVGLDGSVVAIANPKIAENLHASLSDLQWITNAYLLALAALLILGGKLGDRLGRRLIFLIGVIGFGGASMGIGLIGSIGGIIVLRVLQGVFGALLMPNTLAIVRSAFPADKLNAAIGIWAGASAVSVAAGPILGGLLVEHVSWESIFYINAPIALITVILGTLAITESRSDNHAEGIDLPGVVTLVGALFLVVFGLIKAQEWSWGSDKTLIFLIGGAALLSAFVGIERRTANPLVPMHLFANRSISIGTLVIVVNFFAMFGVLFFITLYLQSVQGFSPVGSGIRTLPLSMALMISAPVGGLVTQKLGPRIPMAGGLLAVAVALGLMTSLTAGSNYNHLWPAFLLIGIGLGFVMTSSSDAIVGNAGLDEAGIAGGLQSTAIQLGGVLGTSVLGSVLSSKVGSVLMDKLTGVGVPRQIAAQLEPAKEYVAQGVAPNVPGVPGEIQRAIVTGSHDAFMTGLHTAMWVGVVTVVVGAVLALLVERGENSGRSSVAIH